MKYSEIIDSCTLNPTPVQHERGPRKSKQQNSQDVVKSSNQQHLDIVKPPPSVFNAISYQDSHQDNQYRYSPYSRIFPRSFENSTSGLSLNMSSNLPSVLYQTTSTSIKTPFSLMRLIVAAEKCQELHWNGRSQADINLVVNLVNADDNRRQEIFPSSSLASTPIQETTAKLLFMVVQWIRDITPFQDLSDNDRHILLEETWTQLFLIHLAQWSKSWDVMGLLEDEQILQKLQDNESLRDLITMKKIMHLFRVLAPDESECGCMKAVALFTPDLPKLIATENIEMLHIQALYSFYDYTISQCLHLKFLGFMRLLFLLNHVKSKTIEMLFFRDTVGQIPIAHLLNNMYKTDQKIYHN